MSDDRHADISIHHIPVRGGIGTGLIVAFIVFLMVNELPQMRWVVIPSIAGGLVFGIALIAWRKGVFRRH